MSGTTAAPDCGLLHPVAVPAAIEASAPVLWPLHLRLVFERMVQPESATFGAPLKVSVVSAAGCPVPRVRMQEVSAWLPPVALPLTPIGICWMPAMPTNVVGTEAEAVPT